MSHSLHNQLIAQHLNALFLSAEYLPTSKRPEGSPKQIDSEPKFRVI